MRTFTSTAELHDAVGEELGRGPWVTVDQPMINGFADNTGDHQWIHVDVDRATQEGPYGGPVAHGYLTLSLVSALMDGIYSLEGTTAALNYGLNKVRFPRSVPAGSKLQASAELTDVLDVDGGVQVVCTVVVSTGDGTEPDNDKPVCVASTLTRLMTAEATTMASA